MLARVRQLHLRARHLTDAMLMGAHRSRRVGQAIEFADYQEYQPGMDLRGLDYRVWGRSDRYVVKRFETETELPCAVVLDLSGDMVTGQTASGGYPSLDRSKAGYAITLAATLLYWLQRHGEPIGLELIAGTDATFPSLPARSGRNHLQLCFLMLASAKAGGRANLANALGRIADRVRRRSLVTVVSDGMEEPAGWLPSLTAFGRRGADTRFVHLFDADELQLAFRQPSVFYSPEGGAELAVDPIGARDVFAEVVAEYQTEVETGVVQAGGRYIRAATSTPLESVLQSVLHR